LEVIDTIQRVQQINLTACSECGGVHHQLSFSTNKIDDMQNLILQAVYNESISDEQTIADLALFYGDTLWSSVITSIQKQKLADSYQANLQEWLNRQHNNIYKFATAKSYAELLEYRNQIIDPNTGEMRSFDEFKKYCDGVKAKYRTNWLEAEYNAVVNGTIQGVNWLQYQENKDLFPYLKYVAINDSRTREAHRALNGIIESIDSKFWAQYYPPNGWNCRCLTVQLSKKQAENEGYTADNTDASMKRAGNIITDKYWRKNTGTGSLFDEKNTAYFQAMPSEGKN
jgi:SPP1 gp7 family putative phage head morphogenesis protein